MRCYEVTEMYALIDISNRPYLLLSHLHRRNRRIRALNNES
jgi:hypothetical protein